MLREPRQEIPVHPGSHVTPEHPVEPPAVQHEKGLLDAGQKDVHVWQHPLEPTLPVDLAGIQIRVRHGHVERRGDAEPLHATEQAGAFLSAVRVHAPHERRVAEVEELRSDEPSVVDVVGQKGIVRTGAVEKDAVHAGRADDHRVRTGLARGDDHAMGEGRVLSAQDLEDGTAQEVISHLSHQTRPEAQAMEGQSGVRHGASGARHRRADVHQCPGHEE